MTHSASSPISAPQGHDPALADLVEWRRWQSNSGWTMNDPSASQYQASGQPKDQWSELRYHHLVPDPEQWDAVLRDRPLPRPPNCAAN